MNRLFLGFAFDVAWRSLACTLVAFGMVLPPVLAWGLDRVSAVMFALLVGSAAAIMLSMRFATNLTWLQLTPVSRSRVWWYSYFANWLPLALITVFFFALAEVGKKLPASEGKPQPRVEQGAGAQPEAQSRFAPFGHGEIPYFLLFLTFAHGLMINPPRPSTRPRQGRTRSVAFLLYVIALFALPDHPLAHSVLFIGAICPTALAFADLSARGIGLPRVKHRRLRLRIGAVTSVMMAVGLVAIWR